MKVFFLFSILLIGAINGQSLGTRICNPPCPPGYQCGGIDFEPRCERLPPSTPAPPPPKCGANEELDDCHSDCKEKKCPVSTRSKRQCILICTVGCSCVEGFLRDPQGNCVKESECPPIAPPAVCNLACKDGYHCDIADDKPICIPIFCTLPCRSGYHCVYHNNKPACIPIPPTLPPITKPTPPPPSTCAYYPCPNGTHCYMVYPIGCPRCTPHPQCLAVNSCLYKKCPPNNDCILVQQMCSKQPCDPIAECRARKIW